MHTHIHQAPLPSSEFLFEGEAYGLPWERQPVPSESNQPLAPSIDYAIFLINAVKFHLMQLLHLFDEEDFNAKLQLFYANPDSTSAKDDLWYVNFLLIIAFGKALVQHRHQGPRPPGAGFFEEAQRLLPNTDALCREPIMAMEILCCIALYQHALDSRNAAHVTVREQCRAAVT